MGHGTSKTRKLTVENDDPTNVIKLSENVVDRIRGTTQTVRSPELPTHTIPQGVPFYMYEPSLTTIQLRQANVAELKQNDDYWQNRMRAMEENHKKMNMILDEEYKKALEEFQTGKPAEPLKEVPCLESQKAVMECYRNNSREPMNCAKIVQAFQECVDHKRSCLLATRVTNNG